VTQEGRFADLVRELGHSIATQYSLTYLTPRPIEDGTSRQVELDVDYDGQTARAETSYQVRGIGGAAINEPTTEGAGATGNLGGTGLTQISLNWWNAAVPLLALIGLFGLSQMRFGVPADELKAIVEAQGKAPMPRMPSLGGGARTAPRSAPAPPPPARPPAAVSAAPGRGARLATIEPADPIPAEYELLKDEISIGRGDDNDVVIPHASVSRAHARLMRRDGGFELMDLNSTNGSFINSQQVHGTAMVTNGSEVRLGNIRFVLRF
jgi:hypothetical protein